MTITMQGALYAALALSPDSRTTQLNAPKEDTCEGMQRAADLISPDRMATEGEPERALGERQRVKHECHRHCYESRANGTQPAPDATGDATNKRMQNCDCETPTELLWTSIVWNAYSKLSPLAEQRWGRSTPDDSSGYNGGVAFVFMGQTTLSSVKGGLHVEETGQLEYTTMFVPYAIAKGVAYDPDLVMVKGGNMKLWTSEEGRYST
jgi:hypothetical protein